MVIQRAARIRILRISTGLVLWTGLVLSVFRLLALPRLDGGSTFEDVWSWLSRQEIEFEVAFPAPAFVEVGDAVVLEGEDGRRIGEVSALLDESGAERPELYEWVRAARIRMHDRAWPGVRRDATARLVKISGSFAWVLRELVPAEKLEAVADEWKRAWRRDRDAILAAVAPALADFIADVEETVKREMRPFTERHRREIDDLLRRVELALDADELARLFETELWPIIRRNLVPVTDTIGREIWSALPLWSLSWRLAYQSLPLTRNDYFEERWRVFMRDQVEPILRSHSADFVEASRKIARESLTNREVASTLHGLALRVAGDPEFHRLVRVFVREVFTGNPRFRALMARRWESPRVQSAVRFVSERLEVTVRRLGDLLLGTRQTGISPQFARVLRAQILYKGRRRIELDPGTPSEPLLAAGARIAATVEVEER